MLRQTETVFNTKKPNVDLCDFPYTSERLIKAEDLVHNIEQSYAKIVELAFDSPIIVHNYMQFGLLR